MDRDTDAEGAPVKSFRSASCLRTAMSSGESALVSTLTANTDTVLAAFAWKYSGSSTH
jgi:hypothetical protein